MKLEKKELHDCDRMLLVNEIKILKVEMDLAIKRNAEYYNAKNDHFLQCFNCLKEEKGKYSKKYLWRKRFVMLRKMGYKCGKKIECFIVQDI